jgi:hypothetical protein
MDIKKLAGSFVAAAVVAVTPAGAQTATGSQPPVETRPATTTSSGDTGLWFVPHR